MTQPDKPTREDVERIVAWLRQNSRDRDEAPREEFDDHADFAAGRAHEASIILQAIERGDYRAHLLEQEPTDVLG